MNKCGGCGKFLAGGAVCTKCKLTFHKGCVNITTNITPKNWICPGCVASAPRVDNTDTPVKVSIASQELEQSPRSDSQRSDCNDQHAVLAELRALREDMAGFRKELGSFREEVREEMQDMHGLFQHCNSRIDVFDERLNKQDSRICILEAACMETQDLKLQIRELKQDLNNREQTALQNDIEINGVTEHSGENVMHITGLIMSKIGLKVDERDIVEARRVGPVRHDKDGKQQPRPMVVRVTRRAVHEEVLRCARTRRNLTTADIEVAGTPRPVYINERLTKTNRLLFGRARTLCKLHKWSYVWTREGKVLIREADKKTAFRIRSEDDFDRIFKQPCQNEKE